MKPYGLMKRAKDWVGLTIETTREIRNSLMILPKGSICEVTYAHGGLNLTGSPCEQCGIRVFFRKVPYTDVKPIQVVAVMKGNQKAERKHEDWWCCSADYPEHAPTCKNFGKL